MKITVVGFGGSGKSTLATKINQKYDIPLLSLDRIWIQTGGHLAKTEDEKSRYRAQMQELVAGFISQDSWVSEGFYKRLQPTIASQADIIIVLQIPLYRRVYNHLKRVLLQENRHAEFSFFGDLLHVFTLIRRNYERKGVYEDFKSNFASKIIILKNYREVNDYLERL